MMQSVTVIIPTLNEEQYLPNLLDDLQKQTLKPNEIIVVDGNSTDKTKAVAKKYPVTFLPTNKGVGFQRKFGVSKINADWTILFDADVRVSSDFVKKAIEHCQKNKIECACPYYLPESKNMFVWLIYIVFGGIFWFAQWKLPAGAGSCIVASKNVYKQILFNPNLLNDDLDFIFRAGKKFKFRMLPLVVWVSERRFSNYGILPTLWQYIQISYYFLTNSLNKANTIRYTFGKYSKKS